MAALSNTVAGLSVAAGQPPTAAQMADLFRQKYGDPGGLGWAPKRRRRFGYYLPADVYEALVESQVKEKFVWLDIGGGKSVFPNNPALAKELSRRCSKLVVVDPSANVADNTLAHEVAQCTLEEYQSSETFDVATMRMVVEHVERPEEFVRALARLIRPNGVAVLYTVNRRSPISALSAVVPFRFHHTVKRIFWGGDPEDTFPTHYRMNDRRTLTSLFAKFGFVERAFFAVDDLTAFGRFRWLNYVELTSWRLLRSLGLTYPEHCLMGVYMKVTEAPAHMDGQR